MSVTSFQAGQHGLYQFGMGFVFDPSTGLDTLYIAGGGSLGGTTQSELATVAFPSLVVTPVGNTDGWPELSGTGDGTLWGFFPGSNSPTNFSTLIRIDPATGATLETYTYKDMPTYGNWAMKFWAAHSGSSLATGSTGSIARLAAHPAPAAPRDRQWQPRHRRRRGFDLCASALVPRPRRSASIWLGLSRAGVVARQWNTSSIRLLAPSQRAKFTAPSGSITLRSRHTGRGRH